MPSKKVIVSFNPEFFTIVETAAKKQYMNVQDLIQDTLRNRLLKQKKPGRPPKARKSMEDYLTR